MYEITVLFQKRRTIVPIQKVIAEDVDYKEAIARMEQFLAKKHIKENQIISYRVIKIIRCPHCSETLHLAKGLNHCKCGAVFNNFGEEIAGKETASPMPGG